MMFRTIITSRQKEAGIPNQKMYATDYTETNDVFITAHMKATIHF